MNKTLIVILLGVCFALSYFAYSFLAVEDDCSYEFVRERTFRLQEPPLTPEQADYTAHWIVDSGFCERMRRYGE